MNGFFKDYGELCKATGHFYKKHWLGTIIMTTVSGVSTALVLSPDLREDITDKVKSKFKKKGGR